MATTPITKNEVTVISPSGVEVFNFDKGDNVTSLLESADLERRSIVKLNGEIISQDTPLVAGAKYLVIPEAVSKGGFDGGC